MLIGAWNELFGGCEVSVISVVLRLNLCNVCGGWSIVLKVWESGGRIRMMFNF